MNEPAPGIDPLIDVRDLVKSYQGKVVLDGFSLTVNRGETSVIIGGSGSGKSTFARLLVGLERPDSGQIWVDGVETAHLDNRGRDHVRKKFAVVFQSSALLDSMTVFDNVAFPLRDEHLSEPDTERRVHFALRELGVDEASAKMPGELSGGMAKRVAIARAVVTEPEIIVYDEPTSGLDSISSRVVDGLIERMRDSHGVTSVVITHDMATVYEVADQVVLVAHGKAIAQGPPEQIFRSHGKEIEPFALSSGIDPALLAPRTHRKSAADIRAGWEATHPTHEVPPHGRQRHWLWHHER